MKKGAVLAPATFVAVLVLAVATALAESGLHLKLDKSTPEADQVVREAPARIVLDFSEEPELAVTRISVKKEQSEVKLSEVARSEEDGTVLWAAFEQPPSDGVYTVSWTTSSGDGHPIRGEFSFTVMADR